MNKLLRNPWLVAALVIGMAALWWVQMRDILAPGGVAELVAPAVIPQESIPASLSSQDSASEPLVIVAEPMTPTQLHWDSVPTRDPFGPVTTMTPTPSVAVVAQPSSVAAPVVAVLEPTLSLEAVLNTPSAQMAVIDGRIVRVGDKVGGRAVLRINNSSVALGSSVEWPQPVVLKLPLR